MSLFYDEAYDPDDPRITDQSPLSDDDLREFENKSDWNSDLEEELKRIYLNFKMRQKKEAEGNRETISSKDSDESEPSPAYDPEVPFYDAVKLAALSTGNPPKLTNKDIKKYINAKCWINGTYLDSMDTEYLINCKKFASHRLHDKWYWKHFLNLINEEIIDRDMKIGPRRYYPGTEDIPRRGDYYSHSDRRYHIR